MTAGAASCCPGFTMQQRSVSLACAVCFTLACVLRAGMIPNKKALSLRQGQKLGDQDSNLNKQYQKLLCYRYTIPQG